MSQVPADGSVSGGGSLSDKKDCLICWDDISAPEMFEVAGCLHRVCLDCMRKHLAKSLERWGTAVKCPSPGCNSVLLAKDCHKIVDTKQITLMIQREEEDRFHVLDRVYCPNPTCSFLMSKRTLFEHSKVLGTSQTGARKCLSCTFTFCINCKTKWHSKKSCDAFVKTKAYQKSDDAVFEASAKRLGWRKCRNCLTTVERDEGCNHMNCRYSVLEIDLLFWSSVVASTSSVTPVGLSGKRRRRHVNAISWFSCGHAMVPDMVEAH